MKRNCLLTVFAITLFLGCTQLQAQEPAQSLADHLKPKPLYIITDGKKERTLTSINWKQIHRDELDSLHVIKDTLLLSQYGEKGKYGVVVLYVDEQYYKEFVTRKE